MSLSNEQAFAKTINEMENELNQLKKFMEKDEDYFVKQGCWDSCWQNCGSSNKVQPLEQAQKKHHLTLELIQKFPNWMEENFITVLHSVAYKTPIVIFDALLDQYIKKNGVDSLISLIKLQLHDIPKETNFDKWTIKSSKKNLLFYAITNYIPALVQLLINQNSTSKYPLLPSLISTFYHSMATNGKFIDLKKEKEFKEIFYLLLESGSIDFISQRALILELQHDHSKELLRSMIPILFKYGVGLLKWQKRFDISEPLDDDLVNSRKYNDLYNKLKQIVIHLGNDVNDLDEWGLSDPKIVAKIIKSDIALIVEKQENQWQWIFSVKELKEILHPEKDIFPPQRERFDYISNIFEYNSIDDNVTIFDFNLQHQIPTIFIEYAKERKIRLEKNAIEVASVLPVKDVRNLVLLYLDHTQRVKEVLEHEATIKQKAKKSGINLCSIQ